jgi:CheY-like chemotaxis protein
MGAELQQRCRVLVVDDEIDIRESLSSMLSDSGFEVLTAMNGLEALSIVNSDRPPRVIVLDLTMPVCDGHQVMASLQEVGLLDRIPVIVVSAVAYRRTNGAVAILQKPIQFDSLLEVVQEQCLRLRAGNAGASNLSC